MNPSDQEGSLTRVAVDAEKTGAVSILEHTLWLQFSEAGSAKELSVAWLGLLCRQLGPEIRGVVVLGDPAIEEYEPVARWPDENVLTDNMMQAAERALAEGTGVALSDGQSGSALGFPLIVDGEAYGSVAILSPVRESIGQRELLRTLQWGIGNLISALRKDRELDRVVDQYRTEMVMDLTAEALENKGFSAACNAVAIELAARLNCDLVAIGFSRRKRTKLVAISHAGKFGSRMNLVRDIERVMDESIDQHSVIHFPRLDDWEFRIDREHSEVSSAQGGTVLTTIPVVSEGAVVGAIHAQRPFGLLFSIEDIRGIDCAAAIVGPILLGKKREERSIFVKVAASIGNQGRRLLGSQFYGRKVVAVLMLALIAFLATAAGQFRVTSPATIFGSVEQAIVAPFDGYIDDQMVRAGETLSENTVLASMDTREMVIEKLRWETQRSAKRTAFDRALASHERAEANVIASEIDQADAQIQLLDIQLERATLRAPFDGLVLSGDLSQHVGGAVKRGEELFRISPLDGYRLHLEVDENYIAEVSPGHRGKLVVSSLPEEPFDYVIRTITPVSESSDGRTFFRVEAELEGTDPRLRPGMTGIAKTEIDERLLVLIWGDGLIDWSRIFFWKWLP